MSAYDRWQGWPGAATAGDPSQWIDLSHPLRADLPRIPFFPPARFERIMSMPRDPLNVTEIQMVCHFGTHIDAPCHFIPDGPSVDQLPLDRLCGPGVVWRLSCEPDGVIGPEMFAANTLDLQAMKMAHRSATPDRNRETRQWRRFPLKETERSVAS